MPADEKLELNRQNELTASIAGDGIKALTSLSATMDDYLQYVRKSKKRLAKLFVPSVEKKLLDSTQRMFMRSFLLGVTHGLDDKPESATDLADVDYGKGVAFADASKFLDAKIPITRTEWDALQPKMRYRAFMVSRLAGIDNIERVRKALVKEIKQGGSFQKFLRRLKRNGITNKIGTTGAGPYYKQDKYKMSGYWNTVYRTNINSAYNAGRMMANLKEPRPVAYKFSANMDARTTHICRARNGIVKSSTDDFWKTNTPGLHFNCRSTLIPKYSPTPLSKTSSLPKPGKGFGVDPLQTQSFWQLPRSMVRRATKYGVSGDMIHLANALGLKDYAWELGAVMQTVVKDKSGGFVKQAVNREAKSKHQKQVRKVEREIATTLARKGEQVYLLPETKTKGIKNPDAMVNGKVMEFKHSNSTNLKTIEKQISQGLKQADGVVIRVPEKTDMHRLYRKLYSKKKKQLVWVLEKNTIHKWGD